MSRIETLRRQMAEQGLDAFLVTSEPNVRYLSGYKGKDAALLVTGSEALLITDFRYVEQAAREAPGVEVVDRKKDGLVEHAGAQAAKRCTRRLGIEPAHLTLFAYKRLAAAFAGELVETDSLVERLE